MATPPSDSRQPPDGDEFPDFLDNDNEILKYSTPIGYRTLEKETQLNTIQDLSKNNSKPLNMYLNNFETTAKNVNSDNISEPIPVHTRSQSLINLSSNRPSQKIESKVSSRLDELVEQRRKSYSKLKGLVIPETKDNETSPSSDSAISIPEIRNLDTAAIFSLPKPNILNNPPAFPVTGPKNITPISTWTSNTTNSLPKYSPAFKRKSLHVYTTSINKSDQVSDVSSIDTNKYCDKTTPRPNKLTDDDLNPPKSLESIASPTRSDCSFEYATVPKKTNESSLKVPSSKIEDESDNDSAVSSSQSSFNSRFSPPLSPTKSYPPNPFKRKDEAERNGPSRLLSASSTEAINRRNILASAKCSSGNNLLNLESPIESPPPPKRILETPPVTNIVSNEKVKSVREYSDVKSESSPWENRNSTPVKATLPERPVKREFMRSTESLPEIDSSLKVTPRSSIARNYLSKEQTPTKLSDSLSKDFTTSSSSSYLSSRKPKPISVKALTQNFEKFGSSPPPLPQKPMVTKPLIPTKNVRNEILKAENKISVSTENIAKADVVEVRPKPRQSKITPLEVRKSEENLASSKFSEKLSTETVILQLSTPESILGISVTGGADENTDIVIHRIRYGSVAYQDGRLNKGDKILSINGISTKEMTNTEAVELLKEQLPQFIIKRQATDSFAPPPGNLQRRSSSLLSIDSKTLTSSVTLEASAPKTPTHIVSFSKDGSGLGFSIEGGKDSPQGDVPLVIKKIFTGGAADKNGELKTGDEIIFVNEKDFTNLTRIEAWNLMKKIPDGMVKIQIYRQS